MATDTIITCPTTELRLSSGNGPITRTILRTPLRDALPSEIPLIDVSSMFSKSLQDRLEVAHQIHAAAIHNGFFYISNHGVPAPITDEAYDACLDFFRQDVETKKCADASRSVYFNGYKGPSSQRINPNEGVDIRETFSWTYDPRIDPNVAEISDIPAHASKYMRLEDFHWEATSHMPHFKSAIVRYFQACLMLARALTRSFALSLNLPEDAFDAKVQYPDAAIALNYYPSIKNPTTPAAEQEVSIGSHTDFQLFTILWQDSVGGLQVLNQDGQWIWAKPIPGTFVVNIGDYLQRITNDRYISTVHRVQNWSGRERVSMPFFWGFGLHESCGVLQSCVGPEGAKYDEIGCEEWVQRRVRDMLTVDDKGNSEKTV